MTQVSRVRFFPDDPSRRNWVPIFRQEISSTVEDHVTRENYPLTLAWALTHWKAQGMTLDRVRVHLSDRTAAVPGIGFVACTRVRHPWDIVFEEDLPEYGRFMQARRSLAFRERKRFELRQEAKASRTLRRYGFCEADVWTEEEADVAQELIRGLRVAAREQSVRLSGQGREPDDDTYLWGQQEPDYVAELAREVARVAGDNHARRRLCERVSERLLDRSRVRVVTVEERVVAAKLLDGLDTGDLLHDKSLSQRLVARVEELGDDSGALSREHVRGLAGRVAERIAVVGHWDEKIADDVPAEFKPLHMSQVKESLGALIPAGLHKSLDKAASRVKDVFGPTSGGSVLFMDNWRVSVRAEDALARGHLPEDALEFFLLVLRRLCKELALPVAIVSKTVGKEVGRQESGTRLASVMERWRSVWNGEDARSKEELLLMVAVDDRKVAQDWMCVCP